MGWMVDYYNLVIQVFDPRKRAWKPVWYLQIGEDRRGRVFERGSVYAKFADFFFGDDFRDDSWSNRNGEHPWERKRDTFPILNYPLFVGRDDHSYECHFMTDTPDDLFSYFHVTEDSPLISWKQLYKRYKDKDDENNHAARYHARLKKQKNYYDSVQEYHNLVQQFLILARMQLYMPLTSADEPHREFPRDYVVQHHEDDDELVSRNIKRQRCLPSADRLELKEMQLRQTRRVARCRCLDVLFRKMTGGLVLPQVLLEEKILLYAPPEPRKVRIHYSHWLKGTIGNSRRR